MKITTLKRALSDALCVSTLLVLIAGPVQAADQGRMGVSQDALLGERLEHGSTMQRLTLMINMMSETTEKVSVMLRGEKDPHSEKMKAMAAVMKDISAEAGHASQIMDAGKASQEEMAQMQDKMMQVQKKLPEIEAMK